MPPTPAAPTEAGAAPVTNPPVSLVMTVLNEAASLDALLASIAAQTTRPDEVIVVDGGSTDGTVAIAERWGDTIALARHPAAGREYLGRAQCRDRGGALYHRCRDRCGRAPRARLAGTTRRAVRR